MMKINWKFFKTLFVLLAISAVFYGGYLWLRGTELTMPSLFKPKAGARLLMSMEGFRFSEAENGRISWRMKARNADLYESKEARLKDMEITFLAPDKREGTLIGESGTMDTITGNAEIRGVSREVRVVTSDGYLLTTNSLFWNADDRLVRTPDPFKLLGNEIYLEGKGITANLDMHMIVVKNNVKAVLQD